MRWQLSCGWPLRSSGRVNPIHKDRTREQPAKDFDILNLWDNSKSNVWMITLSRWVKANLWTTFWKPSGSDARNPRLIWVKHRRTKGDLSGTFCTIASCSARNWIEELDGVYALFLSVLAEYSGRRDRSAQAA